MLLALATLAGCWRPEPYTPPPPPVEDEPGAAAAGEDAADDAPDGEDAPDEAADDDDEPPFDPYPARTVQAPVTIVDDWGKPLAVLGASGWELEVRGEDTIRTRVWCGSCTPAVEGWIQAHLVTPVR